MTNNLLQRAASFGLAAMLTLAMLGSVHVLAMQPAHEAELAQLASTPRA